MERDSPSDGLILFSPPGLLHQELEQMPWRRSGCAVEPSRFVGVAASDSDCAQHIFIVMLLRCARRHHLGESYFFDLIYH